MRNIGDVARLNARYYPDKTAIVDSQKILTWKAVNERSNRLANALVGLGCRKGDRVAILLYNCPEYVESIFACAKAGLIFVGINFRLSAKEIEYLLNDCKATALLLDPDFSDIAERLKKTHSLSYICTRDNCTGALDYESMLASGSPYDPPGDQVSENDPAEIYYTSGTTGLAKGVVHSHRARLQGAQTCVMDGELQHEDVYLLNVPALCHTAGWVWTLAHFYVGASIVISRLRGFDPQNVLENIQNHAVTCIQLVPLTIMQLIEFPRIGDYDFSSLRLAFYATAPMPIRPLKKALDIFGNIFMQPYGLTETGPNITCLRRNYHSIGEKMDAQTENRLKSCGRPCYGIFVKLVDENGKEVPPGTVGEIIVKSNDMMEGYWNNESETQKIIKDGWLYTGDLATYDEDFFIYLVDRKKDMIISGGLNIYPAEVERVIYEHPAVKQCAVIGVPDDRWGEAVKAFVVLQEGQRTAEEEIIAFCRQSLASYKKPKSVEFIEELPTNAQGKLLKRVLREKYWRGRERNI